MYFNPSSSVLNDYYRLISAFSKPCVTSLGPDNETLFLIFGVISTLGLDIDWDFRGVDQAIPDFGGRKT